MPAVYLPKKELRDVAHSVYELKANPPELMTVKEVALFLSMSLNSIYLLVRNKEIPYIKLSERAYRFKREEIRAWVKERATEEEEKEKAWEQRLKESPYYNA